MKNYKLFKLHLFLFFSFLSVLACEEPFVIDYDLDKGVIIVNAVLTDELDDQYIRLSESRIIENKDVSAIIPIKGATVEVIVNETEKILFTENPTGSGNYLGPHGFKAEANKSYQLVFTTNTGKKFQSKKEKLEKGIEIKKVYQELVTIGKPIDKNFKAFHKIYLDTTDPANTKNFYLWDYNLYELNEICKTCEPGERYYNLPLPGVCVKDLPAPLRNVIYDYECYGACWEILHSNKINIMNDDFSNGKTITARPIAEVPIYHLNAGAVIEIKQQSISQEIYKYYNIMMEQVQKSGGLADTPPISLIGNIESADNETVAGYFRVTDESKFFYWVDRSDVLKTEIKPIFLIGRPTNFEPGGEDITRPPLVPCVNSYSRTNKRPKGWLGPL